MTKDEQIKLLLQGVEVWNARRESEYFTPGFAGANLPMEFYNAGRYEDFGLLPLKGVNLSGANLVHSTLNYFDLANANFMNADLRQAKLVGSNLNNANFFNADLRDADLSCASLAGATFGQSQSEIQNKQPWKAVLFPNQNNPEPLSRELKPIKTAADLLGEIKRVVKFHKDSNEEDIAFYFRGEPKHNWPLRPSVKRLPKEKEPDLSEYEDEMLSGLISRRPEDFVGTTSALDEWGIAQHYRLPTRFLDITRNPLVALYFACEDDRHLKEKGRLHIFAVPKKKMVKTFSSDAISIITNLAKLKKYEQDLLLCKKGGEYNNFLLAKLRLYQGIKKEKSYFDERIDIRDYYKVFVVEPKQTTERIRAQSGAFLVSAFHDDLDGAAVMNTNPKNPPPIYAHYKLEIPKDTNKLGIMDELRLLNITSETLLPGLDSSAKAVKEIYSSQQQSSA